jgi:hypothetical protein
MHGEWVSSFHCGTTQPTRMAALIRSLQNITTLPRPTVSSLDPWNVIYCLPYRYLTHLPNTHLTLPQSSTCLPPSSAPLTPLVGKHARVLHLARRCLSSLSLLLPYSVLVTRPTSPASSNQPGRSAPGIHYYDYYAPSVASQHSLTSSLGLTSLHPPTNLPTHLPT